MGIEINKSGMSIKSLEEKFGFAPQSITEAPNSSKFACREPEFKVEEGRLVGGDFEAMERLNALRQKESAQEEPTMQEAFVSNSAIAPEMC